MYRPINNDRPFAGVSLAESFAERYALKYNVDVGLIPCADGGTPLELWKEGGVLFDNAVYQSRLAERSSTIAGVLWHQGEGDCRIDLVDSYTKRFQIFVKKIRESLNLFDVPFLIGGLGDFLGECVLDDNLKNYDKLNQHLQRIAELDPLIGFVSAKGLDANEDNLHFNAKSLYEFGLRYFDEFEKLRNPNKKFVEKVDADNAFRTEMERL